MERVRRGRGLRIPRMDGSLCVSPPENACCVGRASCIAFMNLGNIQRSGRYAPVYQYLWWGNESGRDRRFLLCFHSRAATDAKAKGGHETGSPASTRAVRRIFEYGGHSSGASATSSNDVDLRSTCRGMRARVQRSGRSATGMRGRRWRLGRSMPLCIVDRVTQGNVH